MVHGLQGPAHGPPGSANCEVDPAGAQGHPGWQPRYGLLVVGRDCKKNVELTYSIYILQIC